MKVASFYRFLDLQGPEAFKSALQDVCEEQELLGTILVAHEGFNGSLTGEEDNILAVFKWIENTLSLDEPIEARWNEVSVCGRSNATWATGRCRRPPSTCT